ncbi:MAG: glycerophosphodiester phosphodiesterase family protein [Acidobacteriota bacterium]
MTMVGRGNVFVRVGRAIAALVPRRPRGRAAAHPTWVIGHRGAARIAPENTIESYGRAVQLGADAIEADICVTKDGHFVVWHDADPGGEIALARQAGREELLCTPDVPTLGSRWRRAVCELTLAEFRAHYGYTPRRGGLADLVGTEGPPDIPTITLLDLFAWADRETRVSHVFLDVKLEARQTDRAVELLDLVRERVLRENARPGLTFHYLSPQREVLQAVASRAREAPLPPALDIHADFELPGVLASARALGISHISMGVGQRFWNEFRLEVADVVRARERGRVASVVVWTISEPERLRELVRLGVDGILTDDPEALRGIVNAGPAAAPRGRKAAATV